MMHSEALTLTPGEMQQCAGLHKVSEKHGLGLEMTVKNGHS